MSFVVFHANDFHNVVANNLSADVKLTSADKIFRGGMVQIETLSANTN